MSDAVDNVETAAVGETPSPAHIGLLLLAAPLGATLASYRYLTVRAEQLAAPGTFSAEDAALTTVTISAHLLLIGFGFSVTVLIAQGFNGNWRRWLVQVYPLVVTCIYVQAYLPHTLDLAFFGAFIGGALALSIAANLFLHVHKTEYPGLNIKLLRRLRAPSRNPARSIRLDRWRCALAERTSAVLQGRFFGYPAGSVVAALTLLLFGALFLPVCVARTQARIERDSAETLVTIEPLIRTPSTCAGRPLHLTYSGSKALVFNCRLSNRRLASVVYYDVSDVKVSRDRSTETPGMLARVSPAWTNRRPPARPAVASGTLR